MRWFHSKLADPCWKTLFSFSAVESSNSEHLMMAYKEYLWLLVSYTFQTEPHTHIAAWPTQPHAQAWTVEAPAEFHCDCHTEWLHWLPTWHRRGYPFSFHSPASWRRKVSLWWRCLSGLTGKRNIVLRLSFDTSTPASLAQPRGARAEVKWRERQLLHKGYLRERENRTFSHKTTCALEPFGHGNKCQETWLLSSWRLALWCLLRLPW